MSLLPRLVGRALCCAPCLDVLDDCNDSTIWEGNAFDIIVIQKGNQLFQNSEFLVSFGGRKTGQSYHKVVLEIQGGEINDTKAWFPITRLHQSESGDKDDDDEQESWSCFHPTPAAMPGKLSDLNGTTEASEIASQLAPFLHAGKNPIRYLLLDHETVIGVAHANIFVWSHRDRVAVVDVDGTITKSNVRGVLDTIVTESYKYCHEGVCNFLSKMEQQPNTQILYLTSRPIVLATTTRKFLANMTQDSSDSAISLPGAPLLGFGGNLPEVLVMELITKRVHHFKARTLWNQVVQPFQLADPAMLPSDIFLGAFGNSWMDVQAYHMAKIDLAKVYIINKRSRISVFDKSLQSEWANLTKPRSDKSTIGVPVPRSWYKAQMGSVFSGYSDPELVSHILTRKEDIERDQVEQKGSLAWTCRV
jgi:phosphatidate phosphatase PAH1